MRSKGDSASPEGRRDTGLVLDVKIIQVCLFMSMRGPGIIRIAFHFRNSNTNGYFVFVYYRPETLRRRIEEVHRIL